MEFYEPDLWARFTQLSAEEREEAKYRLLDAVLSMLGGVAATAPEDLDRLVRLMEPGDHRSVLPQYGQLSLSSTGFLNGYLMRQADWGDTYWSDGVLRGHPSDLLAAVLVLADAPGITGQRVLELVRLSYEIWAACYRQMPNIERNAWDQTTIHGVAVPILAAAAYGDSPSEAENAVRLSASGAMLLGQIRAGDVTNWKAGASGYAIARAFWCYNLAKFFVAPTSMIEGDRGWNAAVTELSSPLALFTGTDRSVLADVEVKLHPCFQVAQVAVSCAIELHERIAPRINAVRTITILMGAGNERIANRPGRGGFPTSRSAADHHVPYCVAAALIHGTIVPRLFDDEFLRSAEIRRLADATVIRSFSEDSSAASEHSEEACEVRIEFDDGTVQTTGRESTDGSFLGLSDAARLDKLRQVMARKRQAVETAIGRDCGPIARAVFDLERGDGGSLLAAIHETLEK